MIPRIGSGPDGAAGGDRRLEGRPALSFERLGGGQARASSEPRPARVRDAAGGGLRARQAARNGLRDDHRSRHDRRLSRDRRSARRVHLRGADRPLSRRAPGGSRPLLRDQPRGPRVPSGSRRRRRGVRRVPPRRDRSPVRSPIRSSPSPRRSARVTGRAWPSCSRCGRSATARAPGSSTCRRRSTSRPAVAPASAGRTITPASISGGLGPRRRPRRRRKSFCGHVRARSRRDPRRAGKRRQVGPLRARPRRARALAGTTSPRACGLDAATILEIAEQVVSDGGARGGDPGGGPRSRSTPGPCSSPGRRSPGARRRRRSRGAGQADAGRRLRSRGALSTGASRARAAAARRRATRLGGGRGARGLPGALQGAVRRLHPGRPVRAGDDVPRGARRPSSHPATASRGASRSSSMPPGRCTGSPTRSSGSASTASPGGRSR